MKNLIFFMIVLVPSAVLALLPLCSSHPSSVNKSSKAFPIRVEGTDLIDSTCRNTPNYELCVSTLRPDPRSSGADVAGLGLIVVDAVKAKATSTVDTINKLKKSKPEYDHQLVECSSFYNAILKADVPEAIEALTKGDPKFAEDGMADAGVEAQACENGFKGSNSLLSHENRAVYNLSVVAKAIIRMLL